MPTALAAAALALAALTIAPASCPAGDLIIDLGRSQGVTFVGAFNRWDQDGNHRRPVNPKARINAPEVTAVAKPQNRNRWLFRRLPPGRYDLVILARQRVRVEGFHYPPVLEFDPFIMPDAGGPKETVRDWIKGDIAKSRHYENKVAALFMAGDEKQVRVLVQLLRDKPTSYDAEYGTQVATLRHEVWQYTCRYGTWSKERKTKVLDRILMAKSELRRWTWVWEPKLGGIDVGNKPVKITYHLPDRFDPKTARGLLPY